MLLWGYGLVHAIEMHDEVKQVLLIASHSGKMRKAINYPKLTGICSISDEVLVNRTAVELNLGTGGFDFVIANLSHVPYDRPLPEGHIIKNRYTPLQFAVQSGEEIDHPLHSDDLHTKTTLEHIPVFIISLHSMLPILSLALRHQYPEWKIVYVMTDSSSLPIWLSDHVKYLKELNMIHATITSGQSFGGDVEAINKFSALLLAKTIFHADAIIIGSGPGTVGTGSVWGYSAIETGEIINAVNILQGKPIMIPRISFADRRDRHVGISHHCLTALEKVALTPAYFTLPMYSDWRMQIIREQLRERNLDNKHIITYQPLCSHDRMEELLNSYPMPITTMGRSWREDEDFFQGVMVAASICDIR